MGFIFLPLTIGPLAYPTVEWAKDPIDCCSTKYFFSQYILNGQLFLGTSLIMHWLILPLNFFNFSSYCRIWMFPLLAVLLFIVTILVPFRLPIMMFFTSV